MILGFSLAGVAFAQTTGSVDLLWQADTYLPSWYQGHSLPSAGSVVKVVAIPHIAAGKGEMATSELSFQWQKDGRDIGSASGAGQNTLSYIADLGGNTVAVAVENRTGALLAANRLILAASAPKLVLYEDDPLQGTVFWRALASSTPLVKSELTVRVEPYFFTRAAVAGRQVSYQWSRNGKAVASGEAVITFTVPNEGRGENLIEVAMENLTNALQSAKTTLLLNFNQPNFNF